MLATFMVTPMRKFSANLFENDVHVCGRAFIDLSYVAPPSYLN
jgi:hypothetical protein